MPTIAITASAVISILLGVVILVWPKSLNYAISIWLILYGILQFIQA